MASTIDIFNSAKIDLTKLTGSNDVFSSISEITESSKLQKKFISDVDYSNPENFAKFGLAEEYYKNAINYIATEYPFDGSKSKKFKWINDLNELEYYIFNNEFPKYAGYIELSGTQYIGAFSPSRDIDETGSQNVYINGERYFVRENLNFTDGFAFESWIKFSNTTNTSSILTINTVQSSSGGVSDKNFLQIYVDSGKINLSGTTATSNFAYDLSNDVWHHYAISINENSSSLFVDGILQEKILTSNFSDTAEKYVFYKIGLVPISITSSFGLTGSYSKIPTFKIGSGSIISFDETRFWNSEKTIEKIGRNWFTQIHGNDFSDDNNSSLILYYKFNEGWNVSSSYCLDYSGFRNHGYIYNFNDYNCRKSGSAINSSSLVQDVEIENQIYVPSLSYSTDILVPFYDAKVEIGKEYDTNNLHSLYKKFPSWVLEQEEEQETKHLKQIIQIVSSYFDDLYNKIGEINKLKNIKYSQNSDSLYPFYDKILTSTGFDVTDLFSNLNILEKISSRTETNIFDEDISKIKNSIFQNIYNNLAYILKSKGTEKSLRSFLRSYGISENLVRINLYADKSNYTVSDKYSETIVKKKTITLTGNQNIFLNGPSIPSSNTYTLETSVIFPKNLLPEQYTTSSIAGIYVTNNLTDYTPDSSKNQFYLYVENDVNGHRFCFRTGSSKELAASSSYFYDLYDNTVWNFAIGFYPDIETLNGAPTTYNFKIDFRAVNTNKDNPQYITGSFNGHSSAVANNSGYQRYYIGAEKTNMSGSVIKNANAKYLYCNFWQKYLSNDELISHNRDILSYGTQFESE
jgi:hypothetical protein